MTRVQTPRVQIEIANYKGQIKRLLKYVVQKDKYFCKFLQQDNVIYQCYSMIYESFEEFSY